MVMDFGRRSYRQEAEFGETHGLAKGPIRWYPASPGAKAFPGPHAFISTLWEGKDADLWDDYGVGPGVYLSPWSSRTNRYDAPPGDHYHGTLAWFVGGIPAEVLSGEIAPPPPDPECPVPLSVRDVSTGSVNATYDEVVVIDCDRNRGQFVEQVEQGRVRLWDIPQQALLTPHIVGPAGGFFIDMAPGHLYYCSSITGFPFTLLWPVTFGAVQPGWWAWVMNRADSSAPLSITGVGRGPAGSNIQWFLDNVPMTDTAYTLSPGESVLLVCLQRPFAGPFLTAIKAGGGGSGSGTMSIGSTPVAGGSEGDFLRVIDGKIDRITPGISGTFGGP